MRASVTRRVREALLILLEEQSTVPKPEVLAGMLIERDSALGFEQLLETWTRMAREVIQSRSVPPADAQMVFGFRMEDELELGDGHSVIVGDAKLTNIKQRLRAIPRELAEAARQIEDTARIRAAEIIYRLERQAEDEAERLRALAAEMRARRRNPRESITVREMEERRRIAAGLESVARASHSR